MRRENYRSYSRIPEENNEQAINVILLQLDYMGRLQGVSTLPMEEKKKKQTLTDMFFNFLEWICELFD